MKWQNEIHGCIFVKYWVLEPRWGYASTRSYRQSQWLPKLKKKNSTSLVASMKISLHWVASLIQKPYVYHKYKFWIKVVGQNQLQ